MPTFLVVGATGQQGGGVVEALLASDHPDLTIRALTRNPSSSAAQALASRGVQPVKGDLLDRQSISKALEGADAAYLVTDFRGPEDVEGELKQGKQFADAAKEAGKYTHIPSVVFFSYTDTQKRRQASRLLVRGWRRHLPARRAFLQQIQDRRIHQRIRTELDSHPTSGLYGSSPPPGIGRFFFFSAMAALMGNTKQRYVACKDIGKANALAPLNPEKFNGRVVTIAGQVADVDELQGALEKGEGEKGWGRIWLPRWVIIRLTPHHYRQMFDWLYYENCQPGSVEETRELIPNLLSIEDWAREQKNQRTKSE